MSIARLSSASLRMTARKAQVPLKGVRYASGHGGHAPPVRNCRPRTAPPADLSFSASSFQLQAEGPFHAEARRFLRCRIWLAVLGCSLPDVCCLSSSVTLTDSGYAVRRPVALLPKRLRRGVPGDLVRVSGICTAIVTIHHGPSKPRKPSESKPLVSCAYRVPDGSLNVRHRAGPYASRTVRSPILEL